jgi:hypothetical protein
MRPLMSQLLTNVNFRFFTLKVPEGIHQTSLFLADSLFCDSSLPSRAQPNDSDVDSVEIKITGVLVLSAGVFFFYMNRVSY